MLFGVLLWFFLVFGIAVAALGHPAFYRMMTGRETGSADHPDSFGPF